MLCDLRDDLYKRVQNGCITACHIFPDSSVMLTKTIYSLKDWETSATLLRGECGLEMYKFAPRMHRGMWEFTVSGGAVLCVVVVLKLVEKDKVGLRLLVCICDQLCRWLRA